MTNDGPPRGRDLKAAGPSATRSAELLETLVGDPEMVRDLVVDGLGHGRREGVGSGCARNSGPRKIVILLGAGAASADSRVRGMPW